MRDGNNVREECGECKAVGEVREGNIICVEWENERSRCREGRGQNKS